MELTETGRIRGARTDGVIMLFLYAGTLIIHILMTLTTTIFNLTPDEYSVTAVAAYFNGYNWHDTVATGGYYGYFQSLFYIPVFGMTDEPYLRYRIMLIINGVLMSLVPVIAYHLSRREFGVSRPCSLLFSLLCGWYPCYMLLTKYTWNETTCIVLSWVFALLIFKALNAKGKISKQIFSVLGGLTLVAAYATHGRMLALMAAGIVLQPVVFFSMRKKRVFCFTGFYAAVAAGVTGDYFIKRYIQSILWRLEEGVNPSNTIERMFSKLFDVSEGSAGLAEGVSGMNFLKTLIGHFFYFISSTWGFGAICVVAVISGIVIYYKRRPAKNAAPSEEESPLDDKAAVFLWFTLLVMGAIFVVSVSFKATSTLITERADTMIYGRYTEIFYPFAILAGMLVIRSGCFGVIQSFVALCFGAVVNVLTVMLVMPVTTSADRFVSAMIMNIAPMRYGEGMRAAFTQESFVKIIVTTMTMLFLWLIIRIIRRSDKNLTLFYALPLTALLIYSGIYGYTSYTVPQSKNAANGANKMSAAIELLDGKYEEITCYNVPRERYVKAQFLYPELGVRVVTSAVKLRNADPFPEIVISQNTEPAGLAADGLCLVGSTAADMQIYAGSPEAAQWARDKGLRVSGPGEVRYIAAELPATTNVIKNGHDESADMNYEDPAEENVVAAIPNGAAVYTNYTTLTRAGDYFFTVEGKGVDRGRITLTSNKGSDDLAYEIVEQTETRLCVKTVVAKKTENVRFKLSGAGGETIEVSSLTIKREDHAQ